MLTHILKQPVITEKSLALANSENVFTFEVDRNANKNQVSQAVHDIYGVEVLDVHTLRRYRVTKSTGRKRLKTVQAQTKKALVRVKPGQTIDAFDVYKS